MPSRYLLIKSSICPDVHAFVTSVAFAKILGHGIAGFPEPAIGVGQSMELIIPGLILEEFLSVESVKVTAEAEVLNPMTVS